MASAAAQAAQTRASAGELVSGHPPVVSLSHTFPHP